MSESIDLMKTAKNNLSGEDVVGHLLLFAMILCNVPQCAFFVFRIKVSAVFAGAAHIVFQKIGGIYGIRLNGDTKPFGSGRCPLSRFYTVLFLLIVGGAFLPLTSGAFFIFRHRIPWTLTFKNRASSL